MIRLTVPAMTCAACIRRITAAIAAVDPAARVEADAPRRELRIDGAAAAGPILHALEQAGYPARPQD